MPRSGSCSSAKPVALVCAFGIDATVWWSGEDHCERCHAQAMAMCAQFDRDVEAGKYDADGFTPNERKAHQRRLQEIGRLF